MPYKLTIDDQEFEIPNSNLFNADAPRYKDNIKLWVEALESGKYEQTEGYLEFKGGGFCCLGVACTLFKDTLNLKRTIDRGFVFYNGAHGVLPSSVRLNIGLRTINGEISHSDVIISLPDLNDSGKYNFKQIAEIIRWCWKDQFGEDL